jgi:hypothetical protein
MPVIDDLPSAETLSAITNATVVSRSKAVIASELHGEVVMMNIASGHYFGLDGIGSDIWRRIDPPVAFGALVEGLAADYRVETSIVEPDVRLLLARMSERDAITLA